MKRPEIKSKAMPTRTPSCSPSASRQPAPTQAELTPRQASIVRFIEQSLESKGRAPTIREIGARFRIRSSNGVTCHLKALRHKLILEWDEGLSRSLRIRGKRIILVDKSLFRQVRKYIDDLTGS